MLEFSQILLMMNIVNVHQQQQQQQHVMYHLQENGKIMPKMNPNLTHCNVVQATLHDVQG